MIDRSYEIMLYGITANTVEKLMQLNGWSENEALERFTASKVYSCLEREETKLWQYSPLMLAQLLNDERSGELIFPEV